MISFPGAFYKNNLLILLDMIFLAGNLDLLLDKSNRKYLT